MQRVIRALFVFLLPCLPTIARGSWESMVQVAQPLRVEAGETAVWISGVPYVGHNLNPRDRGIAIGLTVAPNRISCDARCENRNLAAHAGITFALETIPDPISRAPLTVLHDTLRVAVRFGTADDVTLNSSVETILQATLWCGLLNARQVWPDVRFIEYLVEHEALNDLSGVYSLEALDSSAEIRWDEARLEALMARRAPLISSPKQ